MEQMKLKEKKGCISIRNFGGVVSYGFMFYPLNPAPFALSPTSVLSCDFIAMSIQPKDS